MCGINGFNWADRDLIDEMNRSIQHRGPDGDQAIVWDDFSLGHTRLSILDLTESGNQPMASNDKSIWISYNGETYNYQSLKDKLLQKGQPFHSRTDTEVILRCFAEEGTESFSKFNGIFSFCLYDRKNSVVYLVRDRLGIKPLYYCAVGKRFIFSSEIKAFRATHIVPLNINEHALLEYFLTMNISTESFFKDIKSLAPGHYLRYDLKTNKLSIHEYFNIYHVVSREKYTENQVRDEKELVDELDGLLNEIVRNQLMADVSVGTICSGGVDSSLLTAIAKNNCRNLKIFNVSVVGSEYDESRFARLVAKHLGLTLIEEKLDRKTFLENYEHCIALADLPLVHPNSVGIYLVSKKAKAEGIDVLLSGEGADELFGGYPRYNTFFIRALLERFPLYKAIIRKLNVLLYEMNFSGYLIEDGASIIHRYGSLPWITQRAAVTRKFHDELIFVQRKVERETVAFMLKDLKYYLLPIILRADRMSMGASLEMRVPFLDYRLVDFAVNLPLKYKIGIFQTKYLLKKVAERYLPKKIIHRKKMGFLLPAEAWLQSNDIQKTMLATWKRINGLDENILFTGC